MGMARIGPYCGLVFRQNQKDFAMKKKFSVEQIVGVLKQAEVGVPIAEFDPEGGDYGADMLSLEGEVRRT